MHVDWPVFGRSHYGLRLVKPLPGPGCFTRGSEFRIAVTGLLAKGLRGEPLPDDIPWAVSTPAGNYVFEMRVRFYRSGRQTAWPDAADQRTFTLLTPAAKAIIGWLRFDDMTHRPHSFTCCPMYASSAAVPCLVLAPLAGHSHTYKRVGFAMVCRWQRSCVPGPGGEGEINVVHGPDAAAVAYWLDVDRHAFEMV